MQLSRMTNKRWTLRWRLLVWSIRLRVMLIWLVLMMLRSWWVGMGVDGLVGEKKT